MDFKVDSATKRNEATYAIYLKLHTAQAAYPAKTIRVVLSELMYADPSAWRAVGITRAALDAYHQAGKKRITGIERAHLTDRKEMVEHILHRDEPLSQDALFSYWRKTDRSVIALKCENSKNSLGDWLPFDNADSGYFPPAAIGFKFRHAIEGDLVRSLRSKFDNP